MMNSDGTIEIRGRAADRIRFKVDRKAVWPSPIEEALKTHPSIREVKACILENCSLLGNAPGQVYSGVICSNCLPGGMSRTIYTSINFLLIERDCYTT